MYPYIYPIVRYIKDKYLREDDYMTDILFLSLSALSAVLLGMLAVTKSQLRARKREVADFKNKEVDIQASVENVKDKIKSITDLYIASDILIHLQSEKNVYAEISKTLKSLYNCENILIYSFDEDKRVYNKEFCTPGTQNFQDTIDISHMKVKEFFSEKDISTTVLNSNQKPLYYLRMSGRRVSTPEGIISGLFTETDLQVLNIYLRQSAMVLDKLKAYKKMERMALTDSLTGLYNRHYAHMRIKEEVKRANREKYPVSVVFVDIDKFKSINDTFGHDVGDIALKHVSSLLTLASREYDVTVRWGGEEFVLLLPNTDENGAYILAERLRNQIANSKFDYCNITASLGIASFPTDDINMDTVISYADSALYHSKQTGRNKTTLYSNIAHMVK